MRNVVVVRHVTKRISKHVIHLILELQSILSALRQKSITLSRQLLECFIICYLQVEVVMLYIVLKMDNCLVQLRSESAKTATVSMFCAVATCRWVEMAVE